MEDTEKASMKDRSEMTELLNAEVQLYRGTKPERGCTEQGVLAAWKHRALNAWG
jgi:hypothetical protein